MHKIIGSKHISIWASAALLSGSFVQSTFAQYDPVQESKAVLGKNLKETTQWWPERKKAREGAPNVVWILLDDVGYGALSPFGGLIHTPNLDSLANNGLRYTNFHTTAICSPTRAALLTGRNSHSVHMGLFPNTGLGTPGYDGFMPLEKATIAEILRENGYNTFAVGKWHLVPPSEQTPIGPFTRWPTGRGIDHFYGFLPGGSTDQYNPVAYEDTRKVIAPTGKLLNEQIADHAIQFIAEQKSIAPEKPFFLYYAPGAGHEPHHVEKKWIDKYKGKFDAGWDKYREQVLENQKKLGVIPANAVLPPRNPGVKAWDALSADEKRLYARFMEVYAGFLESTDYQIGRVIDFIRETGQLDNTLVFVSIGDNGASKEGTWVGSADRNYDPNITDADRLKKNLDRIDLLGTEFTKPNYPLGWANAANTPFKAWKQDANAEGGTHNPLIVFWPQEIRDKGGIRNQYAHVIDILPTTVDLVQAKVPTIINGYPQEPIEGTSLAYSIGNAAATSRHTVQHYEIMGSRSIYKDGWKAEAFHTKGQPFENDKWELYNISEDFNERFDISAKYPDKLKELQDLFDAQAWKFNVYPLKDGTEGLASPTLWDNRNQIILYPGIGQAFEGSAPRLGSRSFVITADAELTKTSEGVLLSVGGRAAGVSLYIQKGKLYFAYNNGDKTVYANSGNAVLPVGRAELKVEYNYEGTELTPKKSVPGTATIYINGASVGEVKIDRSLTGSIGVYESIDLGRDVITAVTETYKVPFAFTGQINKVIIDLK
jgi:arylsulfatase A-like enzyme